MRIKFKNFLDTITSFIRTDATAARVYQFPNKDITVAGTDDVAEVQTAVDLINDSLSDKADLVNGIVPSVQLPSYVDDVLEFANFAALPNPGTVGIIYITLDDNHSFRWATTVYVDLGAGGGLALGETSSTAYRGDRGKTAFDHSQLTSGNPHSVTKSEIGLSNVDNTSDVTKLTSIIGIHDLFIPAAAMWPRVTTGCGVLTRYEMATSVFNVQGLPFDQTTQEFAQFQIVLPRKWNVGTITVVPYWTATAGSGTVQWGISGGAYSNDDALTVAFGTAQTSDDTLIALNDLHIGPETSAITLSGTPADSDFIALQVSRNPAGDTLNDDAILLGISVRLTTDAAKDA